MILWALLALAIAVLALVVLERKEFVSVFPRRRLRQEEERRVSRP